MTDAPRFGISTSSVDGGIAPDVLARAVEERGFDWLLFDDHSYFPADAPAAIDPAFRARLPLIRDLFVVLAYAASATSTLTIGSGVALLPQRDTLHTAKAVVSLATLSGNRMVLGVGVGWNLNEVRNHGADPRRRGAKLDEQLSALRALWSDDEPEFSGTQVRFGPVVARPRPTAPIPILVGGASDAALARAVRSGDGWLPFAELSSAADVARARKWFGEQGRGDLTITVSGTPADVSVASAYLDAIADRILFNLEPGPEDDVLRALDAVTKTVRSVSDSRR